MRQLLEMTLKACLIIREIDGSDLVIKFAINHNYMLSVDEQIVWYYFCSENLGQKLRRSQAKLIVAIEHFHKLLFARKFGI